ncbi:protein SOGA1 isoform X2 [Protopterus annectens]|uniref:protein SOGA1 isoform X2 n=1 Tax=Protopterus annectens TaxID=7888 RepID=UPI001CFB9AD3|nr:protein SOGA1 isoform X2 [Protopterus annectens]
METSLTDGDTRPPPPPRPQSVSHEKRKANRAPSPARPRDVSGWSLPRSRGGGKPGGLTPQPRFSRRSPIGVKAGKPETRQSVKPSAPSTRSTGGNSKSGGGSRSAKAGKGRRRLGSGGAAAAARHSLTDSSSELSDCASEENKLSTDALSSDTESSRGGRGFRDTNGASGSTPAPSESIPEVMEVTAGCDDNVSPGDERSAASLDSRLPLSTSLAFSDLTEEFLDGAREELMREMEELRSENEYLKDEIEELRAEMLEMRDVYVEDDVYQLQEFRQQLDQANKMCRILQYRLRKSERRSLRVAQTGQVDGELIRGLEQDAKVAKDISVRLHNELEVVEKKRIKLEEENEDLRQRLIETDLAKQVLQTELEKAKENSLKRRSSRSTGKHEKKPLLQEDSADLKCQLYFAKEESALMCKKLTKLAKENDSMKEELVKYRSLYGDLDSSLSIDELADTPHSREAELKVHLKLVEEEANILSRRIVELEVENRGLRAEMDDMKYQGEREFDGQNISLAVSSAHYTDSGDSNLELSRHLQFVEEEAELLRRSLMELEDQNKVLMNELNKYKSDHELEMTMSEDSCSVMSETSQEELMTAKLQISELNGKVKKLQYENRVLLSNLQRCDLASCQTVIPAMETDAEAGDSAQFIPVPMRREGPVGGENHSRDGHEMPVNGGLRLQDAFNINAAKMFKTRDFENLLIVKDQATVVSKAIDLLLSDSQELSNVKFCPDIESVDQKTLSGTIDNTENACRYKVVGAIIVRLNILQQELNCFIEKLDVLGETLKEQLGSVSPLPGSGSFLSTITSGSQDSATETSGLDYYSDLKSDYRDSTEWDLKQSRRPEIYTSNVNMDPNMELRRKDNMNKSEDNESYAREVSELQLVLAEAKESIRGLQEQLSQERSLRKEEAEHMEQKILQLKEEHQKALTRRSFELQSLNLQRRLEQKFWSQEKNLLVQEYQQFKQNCFFLFMKLKLFLKHWKQGKMPDTDSEDFLEVNNVKDLYLLIEEQELNPSMDKNALAGEIWSLSSVVDGSNDSKEKSRIVSQGSKLMTGYTQNLAEMKLILKELCKEFTDERRGMKELQQQFAKAKSAWEMDKLEMKCLLAQLESKTGKQVFERISSELKSALKLEREGQQQLLAESYSAVMDITKQLQISEKNWHQEKLDLLQRFQNEQKQLERQINELQLKNVQTLHEKLDEKETASEMDAKGTSLKRAKSVSSMSEFESLLDSSPYLPGPAFESTKGKSSTLMLPNSLTDELNNKNWKYTNGDNCLTEKMTKGKLNISSWDYSLANNAGRKDHNHKQIQRSYTAPDKTGIRIYYSPPVVRRLDGSVVKTDGKIMVEPGFLFTMAKPKELESESSTSNMYSRWLCNFSKQHCSLLDTHTVENSASSPAGFPSSLHDLEISGNMSDDMKEITNCVRQAIRSSSLERKVKHTSSQTVLVTNVGTQTVQTVSIGLQTDSLRSSLQSKSWSSRSSSLISTRSKQLSSSLEKVHSRPERPCCSPRYGSPKLHRRSSTKLDGSKDRSLWNLHQNKQNGSAWARSTTTRDSPVLSGINDGLSSLFNVVEHNAGTEAVWKMGHHDVRPKTEVPKYGIVQEFFRNVCGRSQSPTLGNEKQQLKDICVEDGIKKQEASSSSAAYSPTESVRLLNRRLVKQSCSEEQKSTTPKQVNKDATMRDSVATLTNTNEDTACDCTSQSLTSCFSRPSRSSVRHSPTKCKFYSSDPNKIEDQVDSGE